MSNVIDLSRARRARRDAVAGWVADESAALNVGTDDDGSVLFTLGCSEWDASIGLPVDVAERVYRQLRKAIADVRIAARQRGGR